MSQFGFGVGGGALGAGLGVVQAIQGNRQARRARETANRQAAMELGFLREFYQTGLDTIDRDRRETAGALSVAAGIRGDTGGTSARLSDAADAGFDRTRDALDTSTDREAASIFFRRRQIGNAINNQMQSPFLQGLLGGVSGVQAGLGFAGLFQGGGVDAAGGSGGGGGQALPTPSQGNLPRLEL